MKFLLLFFLGICLFLSSFISSPPPTFEPLPCLNKKFSVIVHIVKDTFGIPNILESQIQTRLGLATSLFSEVCVSFEICEFRYIDNFQYNKLDPGFEWDQLQNEYHVKNHINMFFVKKTTTDSSFATHGGIAILDEGGLVFKKNHSFRIITQQLGYYFGLFYTNHGSTSTGSNSELVDGSNCATTGDLICDTPADPYYTPGIKWIDSITHEFIYMGLDANGEYYIPHVQNVMSPYAYHPYYYPNIFGCDFTYQQYVKMTNTYLNSNPKMW